jgi:hypothetical protein
MNAFSKTLSLGITAALLLGSLTTGASGLVPGGASSIGGGARSYVRMTGTVLCAQCNLNDIRSMQPQKSHVYELTHTQGQVVMEVTQLNHPNTMVYLAYPPRLQVRASDTVFARLTAEENLRKEVEITGMLNNTRTLDIFDITIRG